MPKEALYLHQADYVDHHYDDEYYAMLWEMGAGKTRASLEGAAKLYLEGEIHTLIVIAPNGVHPNWPKRQAPLWLDVPYDYIIWNDKRHTKAWRVNTADVLARTDCLRIVAINVEAFQNKDGNGYKFIDQIVNRVGASTLLVIDESSTIKSPKANRSKQIVKIARQCAYRRILTGTPVTQSPFDIWMQGEALCKNIWRKNFYMFKQHHGQYRIARFGNRSFEELVCYRHLDEIKETIASFGSEVIKSECMDLPPKVYDIIEVEMTTEQKKAYKQMVDFYAAEVNDTLVTTDTPLTKLSKLHQITTGHLIDEDGVTKHSIPHNRIKALETVVEGLACKTIIFCQYTYPIQEIMELLGNAAVEYSGRINDMDRQTNIDKFQSDPDTSYIVISLQSSGAYGLDLYSAGAVIYYANGYSLERRMQSEDRAHRPGQVHDNVSYIDIICPGTVDENIQEALTNKIDVASQVTRLMTDWLR